MTTKTITEAELLAAHKAFAGMYGAYAPASIRAAFKAIGFGVVPDPIPEPMNGEIVKDGDGYFWERVKATGMWNSDRVTPERRWETLCAVHGPLRIFAEVKP